jgi:hypothetical protein
VGDQADLTLEWAWEEYEEPRRRPTKKQLMQLIKSRRWHRRRLVRLQRFTDEHFYIAIGHQTLTEAFYELERRRQSKPSFLRRRLR